MRKRAIICYLGEEPKPKFLAHLAQFRTREPVILLTSFAVHPTKVIRVPVIVDAIGPDYANRRADVVGTQGFIHGVHVAASEGITEFICLQDDCAFACDYWDVPLWTAYDQLVGAVCAGTPVAYGWIGMGLEWELVIHNMASSVLKNTAIPMALEGGDNRYFGIYPNGALAVYNVDACVECFTAQLEGRDYGLAQPFDGVFGRWLVAKFGVDVAKRFALSTSTYSGCSDLHVNRAVVRTWLGWKTAVHQYKHD